MHVAVVTVNVIPASAALVLQVLFSGNDHRSTN